MKKVTYTYTRYEGFTLIPDCYEVTAVTGNGTRLTPRKVSAPDLEAFILEEANRLGHWNNRVEVEGNTITTYKEMA